MDLKSSISILFILISLSINGYEKSDAFVVKIFDDKVKVLSPIKFDPSLTVIIENKTLVQIKGRIETGRGEMLTHIALEPGKSVSKSVKRLKSEKLFFIPLSPPFQKVELKLGNKPYEIPPRQ